MFLCFLLFYMFKLGLKLVYDSKGSNLKYYLIFWICLCICLISIFSFIVDCVILVLMDLEFSVFDLWLNFCIMKLRCWLYVLFFFRILWVFVMCEFRWLSFLVILIFCVNRIIFCFIWVVFSFSLVFLKWVWIFLCC